MTEHKSRAMRLLEGVILHRQGGRRAHGWGKAALLPDRDFPLPELGGGQEHRVASCTVARVPGPFLQNVLQLCQNSSHNCPGQQENEKLPRGHTKGAHG